MDPVRSFIAVEPDAPVRAWLTECLGSLRRFPGLRPVRPENLHLTLKFLGDVAADRRPSVEEVLQAAAGAAEPFDLEVGDPGAFGPRRAPRTFWIGFRPGPGLDALKAVQARIDEGLAARGFPREDREWSAHLTLGRNPGGASAEGWLDALPPPPGGGRPRFRVDSVRLVGSELTPQGPIYTVLAEAPVGRGARPVPRT
jgi:RNA 2',3'-cyclic 3'-phosphodiesterase